MTRRYEGAVYYIYEHFDQKTNEVVYIGCGTYARAWTFHRQDPQHTAWARQQYTKHGPGSWVRIVTSGWTANEAFAEEQRLIALRKPRFNLTWARWMFRKDHGRVYARSGKRVLTPHGSPGRRHEPTKAIPRS
jgi:hypothetical protein